MTHDFSLSHFLSKVMAFLYLVLFCFVPLFFLTSTSELFELNKMIAVYSISILVLAIWFAKMVTERKVLWKSTPFDIPFLIFFLAQILATLFSIHPHTSIFGYYSRWHGGLLSSLSYLILFYAFVNNFSAKNLRLFLTAILIGGALSALYALPEHFGFSPSCVVIEMQDNFAAGKNFSSSVAEVWGNPGKFFTTDCWSERTNPKYRIFGTFGQPNWLAAYVIMLLPLSLLLSLDKKHINKNGLFSKFQNLNSKFQKNSYKPESSIVLTKKIGPKPSTQNLHPSNFSGSEPEKVSRVNTTLHIPHSTFSKILTTHNLQLITTLTSITFFLLPLALFPTLLFTTSRSGFLGFIISMAIFAPGLIFILRKKKNKKKNYVHLYILYLISYILLALLIGTPFSPSLKSFLSTKNAVPVTQPYKDPGDLGGTDSGDIRKIVWTGAVKVWQRYPILGSGLETFGYSYYQDRPIEHNDVSEWEYLYNKAHNEFLNYLATTGIIGLSAYLLWQLWTAIILIKIVISEKSSFFSQMFAIATLASLSALHVSNFFGFSTVMVSVLFYLLPGMVWLSSQKETSPQNDKVSTLLLWQKLSFFIIIILTIIPLIQILAMWQADYLYAKSQKELRNTNLSQAEKLAQQAIDLFPYEGAYYGQLGKVDSELAVALADQEEYELGGIKATEALDASNQMLLLNPYHLSFYRTRVTILLTLASAQPALFQEALKTVIASQNLAPTDPKLPYTEGLIDQALDATPEAILAMQKAVDLKPDYEGARWQLGQLYETQGEIDQAIKQYQYMVDHIPTGNTPTVQERLDMLEASLSGVTGNR